MSFSVSAQNRGLCGDATPKLEVFAAMRANCISGLCLSLLASERPNDGSACSQLGTQPLVSKKVRAGSSCRVLGL